MKKVLIADTDPTALKTFSRVLKSYSNIFQIVTAQTYDDAVNLLSQIPIDMVVADVTVSDDNSGNLCRYINTHFPDTPLVITATPENETSFEAIEEIDIYDYFKKPVDIHALSEKILNVLNENIHGEVHGIGLPYFLQMLELEEKTCTLTISMDDSIGHMTLLNGELIAAETETNKNEKAVYEILNWDSPSIVFENFIKDNDRHIRQPLASLILDALRLKDESRDRTKKTHSKTDKSKKTLKKTKPRDSGIEFNIGTYMHIRVEDVAFTYRSPLLGMKPDHFLILGMPDNFDQKVSLYKGKDILVKYIFEGAICAFKAKLLGFVHTPAELLFLEYPNLVGYHNIRLHHRVKCFIPATASTKNITKLGVIVDISKKGCGCLIQNLSGEERPSFGEGENISLMCRFPGVEGEVHIMGIMKNVRISPEGMILGVQFHESISGSIQEIISQFVVTIGDLQIPS